MKTRDYQQKPYIVTWMGKRAEEDMDGKCETRPCSKRRGLENDPGYYQGQREVETSCKNIFVGKYLMEEKRR